ncbi:MAG: tetratricopeptide repeat protein [Acidobacteriota bacterium]|nr:MAG: tetratricopeptide repeat protein [Acidobacteriota bacterium]
MFGAVLRALILVFLLGAVLPSVSAQSADDYLRQANELYQARQYRDSLAAANRATTLNPLLSEAFRRKGWCWVMLGDFEAAVEEFSRAIKADPANKMAFNGRGYAHHRRGDNEQAVADLSTALDLDPDYGGAYTNLGLVKAASGDLRGAEAAYKQALRINPRSTETYNNLANLAAREKDHQRSISLFSEAIELDPSNAVALRNRALERYYVEDFEGAIEDATRSLELIGNSPDAYNNRGLALMARGDFDAARRDLEQALELDPQHRYARANLEKLRQRVERAASTGGSNSVSADTRPEPARPSPVPGSIPAVTFVANDPCQAARNAPPGLPWDKGDSAPLPFLQGVQPATLPPLLDFNTMSAMQYNGAVSTAMEGMRLVYGEMPLEEEQRFHDVWAPLFDFPTEEATEYLNELNPLLSQFLAGSEAFSRATAAYQITMYDSGLAVIADSRQGYFDAMESAFRQAEMIQSLEAGLLEIAGRIQALGNPPNPFAAKCEAQRRFKRSLDRAKPTPDGPWVLAGEWVGYSESDLYPSELPRQVVHMVLFPGGQNPFSAQPMRSLLGFGFSGGGDPAEINWTQEMLDGVDGDELEYSYTADIDGQEGTVHVYSVRVSEEIPEPAEGLRQEDAVRLTRQRDKLADDARANQQPGAAHDVSVALELDKYTRAISYIESYNRLRYAFHLACLDWLNNPPADLGDTLDWSDRQSFRQRYSSFQQQLAGAVPASDSGPTPQPGATLLGPKAAERAALEETVNFHKSMVALLNRNLQQEVEELNRETEEKRRKQLMFRVIQLQSDIQAEQDLIASYTTGRIVHTRSAFDVMASEQFVRRIQEEAARVDAVRRIAAGVERQIELLPWEVQATMREKARAILDSRTIATGDVERARKVASALNEQVQGYWQGVAAREDEKAINAEEYETYINAGVMAAGTVVVGLGSAQIIATFGETAALSLWAPHLIGGIYGGVTGTIAGGPVEGVKQTVNWVHPIGFMATSFLDGYNRVAEDPNSKAGDRVWAGAVEAGKGYLIGKAMQLGVGVVTRTALHFRGPNSRLFKPVVQASPAVKQQFAAAKFQQDVDDARSLIGFFKERRIAFLRAQQEHPAGSPQLAQLEGELKQLAASLNSSYHCKWLLKYDTHPSVRRAFSSLVDQSYQEMMPGMIQRLESMGYDTSNLRFRPLRNASSAGSASMDLDLALQEAPNMRILKNNRPVSLEELQRDAQRALNESYHSVTGFSASRSELALTTSVHQEAFANKGMLGSNPDFSQFTPEEMASIGRVVNVKTTKIQGDPVLGDIAKVQSKCRESAKEIENMMLKNLRQKLGRSTPGSPENQQLQADIRYWEDMLAKFKRIGSQTTDPYEILQIERSIRQDTGGMGSQEVIGTLMSTFGFDPSKARPAP